MTSEHNLLSANLTTRDYVFCAANRENLIPRNEQRLQYLFHLDTSFHIGLSRYIAGADPGFSFREAQKIMCAHAHYEREA